MNNKALIIPHMGIGDQLNILPIVKYIYDKYETIFIICTSKTILNVQSFYKNYAKVNIIRSINRWFKPEYLFTSPIQKIIKNNCVDIYGFGIFRNIVHNLPVLPFLNPPFVFYEEFNLPYSIFWSHFELNVTDKALELLNYVKDIDYVFIHPNYSEGCIFDLHFIENHLGKTKNDILIIDSSTNHYKPEEPFYNLANLFINHLVHDYTEIIKYAHSLYLSDSCFFCLSLHLDIKTNNCFVLPRFKNTDYSYIWTDKYSFPNTPNLKKFITLNSI
jgi:hypothetical protein